MWHQKLHAFRSHLIMVLWKRKTGLLVSWLTPKYVKVLQSAQVRTSTFIKILTLDLGSSLYMVITNLLMVKSFLKWHS